MKRLAAWLGAVAACVMATEAVAQRIEIEVCFLEVDAEDVQGVVFENDGVGSIALASSRDALVERLNHRKETDVLYSSSVVTANGSQATVKAVTEYIYPTEFGVHVATTTNGTTVSQQLAIVPNYFAMREVGVILTVTPEVTSDNRLINLMLTPAIVDPPTWENYDCLYVDTVGNEHHYNARQPIFPVRSMDTRLTVPNGGTAVVGGVAIEDRETSGKRRLLVFAKASSTALAPAP
ncbi:MAG: type II and III secretion system protein [Kiritimatiellaeota bacterium]|nr:type II and III secretion system protein [Kiritimatiellota bacterium]